MQCSFVEKVRILLRISMFSATVFRVSYILVIQKKMRFNLLFIQGKKMLRIQGWPVKEEESLTCWARRLRLISAQGK